MIATYNPPSYFDYDGDLMNPAALDKWATDFYKSVAINGGTPDDVVDFKLADEPGWYFPQQLRAVIEKPTRLAVFHEYLRTQGFKPNDFGKADWSEVLPIGFGSAKDLPSRKLYYHTMRFYPESASRAHRLATEALQRAFKNLKFIDVNWNNWGSRWYTASPNKLIANNNLAVPDSAYGMFDWFESGRLSAHTLWTEDWFGDQSAQTWSYYTDMMRSAAMLGKSNIGSYVIGATISAHPYGARYKVMSLVGHGGKGLDMYTWGPNFLFGDGWSEGFTRYRPIAEALRTLGKSERLVYPGKPERGKVAILVPGSSTLWENDQHSPLYDQEMNSLHHALIHAGYTVDFVDEKDVAGDDWKSRGYTTLYITGPNILRSGQEKIVDWVRRGGTLVATPGAGVADEYNSPTNLLDPVLGLKSRSAVRDAVPHPSTILTTTGVLQPQDARFSSQEIDLLGPVIKLETEKAATLATFKSGGAAITANIYGKGRAIAYGFFPGWQYWKTPDRLDATRLPLGWGKANRQVIVAPVNIAKTPRPVVLSQEVVEACRLQSDKGIAIVLLNWTDEPISSITVTVPRAGAFRKVSSVEQGVLKSTSSGDTLRVTMPLKNVDVLMIE